MCPMLEYLLDIRKNNMEKGTGEWKQFLQNKNEMLQKYSTAKIKETNRPIKVEHGITAEAEFRKWLRTFLPKRYGVTSGYIITQAKSNNTNTSHFDIIIYDQLNSPILWIDDNPDENDQGKSKAIPVEYVHGVIEIKSNLTNKSLKDGLSKLDELDKFLSNIDDYNEKYKTFLPENFFSALVFFEIKTKEQYNKKLLDNLIYLKRGFYGAIILSVDGNCSDSTAIIKTCESEKQIISTAVSKKCSLIEGYNSSNSIKVDNSYYYAMIMWAKSYFSIFAFDLLASINGTFDLGKISSFHGIGFGIDKQIN